MACERKEWIVWQWRMASEWRHLAGTPGARMAAAALALLLAIALLPVNSVGQAPRGDNSDAQFTEDGTASCMRCHTGERMRSVAETVHGDTDNPFSPFSNQGCEACHGPGSLHVSRARGGIGFPAMLSFRDAGESPEERAAACLGCHAEDMGELEGMAWQGSIHALGGNTCVNCHQVHTPGNPLVERDAQVELCSTCHSTQIADHRRFEDVGIVFDELKCYNCHDVHQMIREP
jgi:DmsE family decaheme c-type cytochrome